MSLPCLFYFGKKKHKETKKYSVFQNWYSRYLEYSGKVAYLSIVSLFAMQGE